MSTWEERMAAAAAGRQAVAEAERERLEEENDPHRDHHRHIAGSCVVCSCGENFGVTCVAIPGEIADMDPEEARAWWQENVRCSVCSEQGVWSAGGD